MCMVSMIYDHYNDKWKKFLEPQPQPIMVPVPNPYPPYPVVKMPSQEEINEFYELLKRAREYDKKHNQPNCELEEKKEKLRKLAEELGVEIKFDGDDNG